MIIICVQIFINPSKTHQHYDIIDFRYKCRITLKSLLVIKSVKWKYITGSIEIIVPDYSGVISMIQIIHRREAIIS